MPEIGTVLLQSALNLMKKTECEYIFLFTHVCAEDHWLWKENYPKDKIIVIVPQSLGCKCNVLIEKGYKFILSWAGNQSRFSRIKYAFMHGVLSGLISEQSRIICILGPWGGAHLDTITIHDLKLSWGEEFPFDPRVLINSQYFNIVMAMVDIALDIGTSGREGKAVGTSFIIGDTHNVLNASHQAVFNPFKGYPREERFITNPGVVESIKELAQLDGAILISEEGHAVAAGRHLDITSSANTALSRGLGARHRAAAGITFHTNSVGIVISASTGKISIFEQGKVIVELEPVTGKRLV